MGARTNHKPTTFSGAFGVARAAADDWFDPKLHTDTDLFVDPFLMFDNPDPRWTDVEARMVEFFNEALMHVAAAGGKTFGSSYDRAASMLSFPEPPQFCIGYGQRTIFGRGSARGMGEEMLGAANKAINAGIKSINDFGDLMLFGEGFGADRVSDMTCNILMDLFIGYTEDVVTRHGTAVEDHTLNHAGYDFKRGMWRRRKTALPTNPCWKPRTSVMLVPQAFLAELPRMDDGVFWDWVYSNQNEQLRKDLGFLVTTKIKRADIIGLAKRRPELVRKYGIRYAQQLRARPPSPYDFINDPQFKVKGQHGAEEVARLARVSPPASESEFCEFIEALARDFKWIVEDRGLWKNLWHGKVPFVESRVQNLFDLGVVLVCRDRNIDVSPESNAGSGPVDFKFSSGWTDRGIVEVKFAKSSSYWDNLEKQPTTYMKAEGLKCGVILIVQHEDKHCEAGFMTKTEQIVKNAGAAVDVDYRAVFVDGRPKKSASKR